MVEDTQLVSVFHDETTGVEEEKEVETLAKIPPFENVRKPGSDVRTGELVLSKGDQISRAGGEVATLAFVGRKEVGILPSITYFKLNSVVFWFRSRFIRNLLWQFSAREMR